MWLQNGYILWSFQGAKLFESEKHKMFSLAWRPRPEGLLSEEEAKAVVRDLKKHISRFTEEDKRADARRALLERLRKRRSLNEFRAMLATRHAAWEANKAARVAIGAEDSVGEVTVVEQVVEHDLGETVTVVE